MPSAQLMPCGHMSTPAAVEGVYPFRVRAHGSTLQARPFTREHLLSGAVWKRGDLPPPCSKADPNLEHEHVCRLLTCLLSLAGPLGLK